MTNLNSFNLGKDLGLAEVTQLRKKFTSLYNNKNEVQPFNSNYIGRDGDRIREFNVKEYHTCRTSSACLVYDSERKSILFCTPQLDIT